MLGGRGCAHLARCDNRPIDLFSFSISSSFQGRMHHSLVLMGNQIEHTPGVSLCNDCTTSAPAAESRGDALQRTSRASWERAAAELKHVHIPEGRASRQ